MLMRCVLTVLVLVFYLVSITTVAGIPITNEEDSKLYLQLHTSYMCFYIYDIFIAERQLDCDGKQKVIASYLLFIHVIILLLCCCSDIDLDSPVLYINGIAFDETNDNTGILQLEAEDNATSITLNIKLMSIQDQVVSYMTTNATNGNTSI